MKVFRGADFDEFVRELKNQWETVKTAQVKASRDRSREIYILISN
jgi:23S rRNA U2552 (ribose-2'-O)-methylase RlmE/FtsJ